MKKTLFSLLLFSLFASAFADSDVYYGSIKITNNATAAKYYAITDSKYATPRVPAPCISIAASGTSTTWSVPIDHVTHSSPANTIRFTFYNDVACSQSIGRVTASIVLTANKENEKINIYPAKTGGDIGYHTSIAMNPDENNYDNPIVLPVTIS